MLNMYSDNTFILDEHRSTMVALSKMTVNRADHALLYFKNHIYAFGGVNQTGALRKCEQYSIQEDKWVELPEFSNARQSLSVCAFNDKHFFLFGGKTQSNEFVSDVEVFDIDRNLWRTLNYISDKGKLRLVYPGCFQVTGKKIMVFGGCR